MLPNSALPDVVVNTGSGWNCRSVRTRSETGYIYHLVCYYGDQGWFLLLIYFSLHHLHSISCLITEKHLSSNQFEFTEPPLFIRYEWKVQLRPDVMCCAINEVFQTLINDCQRVECEVTPWYTDCQGLCHLWYYSVTYNITPITPNIITPLPKPTPALPSVATKLQIFSSIRHCSAVEGLGRLSQLSNYQAIIQ